MQNATARARPTGSEQQPRLVSAAKAGARTQPETLPEPALAVWRLARPGHTAPLPRELVRQAISHYTDPGDLVLAPGRRGGKLLEQAARLGRRALPLEAAVARARTATGTHVAETVVTLPAVEGADLVLAPIRAGLWERRLAALLSLLRPGGFLVLASPRVGASGSEGLGSIVHAARQSGLQYWQHVVALTPGAADGRERAAQSHPADTRTLKQDDGRAIRCHHDLLVFRRPAPASAAALAAAAVERVAA